jgi:predicted adenylyl cyclase CyaB
LESKHDNAPVSSLRRNLELKARYADLAAAREVLRRLGARPHGLEAQTDNYFPVPGGRLKLRQIEGRSAVLIWYRRDDRSDPRTSSYRLVPVPDVPPMKELLTSALGLRGEVRKRREVYLWHNVRIHLDEVAGLGTFLEFEAVLSTAEEEADAPARLAHLVQAFAIPPSDQVALSYADLLGL